MSPDNCHSVSLSTTNLSIQSDLEKIWQRGLSLPTSASRALYNTISTKPRHNKVRFSWDLIVIKWSKVSRTDNIMMQIHKKSELMLCQVCLQDDKQTTVKMFVLWMSSGRSALYCANTVAPPTTIKIMSSKGRNTAETLLIVHKYLCNFNIINWPGFNKFIYEGSWSGRDWCCLTGLRSKNKDESMFSIPKSFKNKLLHVTAKRLWIWAVCCVVVWCNYSSRNQQISPSLAGIHMQRAADQHTKRGCDVMLNSIWKHTTNASHSDF